MEVLAPFQAIHTSEVRIRRRREATGPRSKAGCKTCRIRRVKCDENKPHCNRCRTTGRVCEWFASNLSDLASSSRSLYDRASITPDASILLQLSGTPCASPQQLRSFIYFQARTVPQLTGVFLSHFWDRSLLQAVHHSDTLKHAVIALGSLHERFENCDPTIAKPNADEINGGFALSEYIKAIGSLVQRPGEAVTPVDVYLVACLLFASFEILRGHHASAVSHVQAGVRILGELAEGRIPGKMSMVDAVGNPLVPLELLVIMFTRLDNQIRQLFGVSVYPAGLAKMWPAFTEGFCTEVPPCFKTIDEARNSLDYIYNDIFRSLDARFTHTIDGGPPHEYVMGFERQRMLARGAAWLHSVGRMLEVQRSTMSAQQMRAIGVMKTMAEMAQITLSHTGEWEQMDFDEYTENYRRVVDAANIYVQDTESPRHSPTASARTSSPGSEATGGSSAVGGSSATSGAKPLRRFQMDVGIVAALFETAWRCRDPDLRRRAIGLLELNPWQEGLWDGLLAARCAHLIVALEEGKNRENLVAGGGMVPAWARVCDVKAKFDPAGGKSYFSFCQGGPGAGGQQIYTRFEVPS